MNSDVSKPERTSQDRIIRLFSEELGYTFLGNFQDQVNRNIIRPLLRESLSGRAYRARVRYRSG